MNSKFLKIAALGVAACGFFAVAVPALAHHSYAMFDRDKTVTIKGTVKVFQWTNPHTYLWVVVKNQKGADELWGIEGGSPNGLSRRGWTKRTMNPGEAVTVELQPLKSGQPGGYFKKATKADGTVVGGDGAAGPDKG